MAVDVTRLRDSPKAERSKPTRKRMFLLWRDSRRPAVKLEASSWPLKAHKPLGPVQASRALSAMRTSVRLPVTKQPLVPRLLVAATHNVPAATPANRNWPTWADAWLEPHPPRALALRL